MERSIIISPSILAADFSDIRNVLDVVRKSGTEWVHLDVMDGNFVPNLSFGAKFIKDMRPHSDLYFDTHLMINEPSRYIDEFAQAGSNSITVHVEACSDVKATLEMIKKHGISCGISFRPKTPVSALVPYLDMVDLVLVMSVEPGFGGQGLIPETLEKVKELVSIRGSRKYRISIDGGVNLKTIPQVYASGVDVAVAGSAFFGASDKKLFVEQMRSGAGV